MSNTKKRATEKFKYQLNINKTLFPLVCERLENAKYEDGIATYIRNLVMRDIEENGMGEFQCNPSLKITSKDTKEQKVNELSEITESKTPSQTEDLGEGNEDLLFEDINNSDSAATVDDLKEKEDIKNELDSMGGFSS